MEFVSRNVRRTPSPSAALERSEYARRDKDMVWYLLRGSIWELYTKFVPAKVEKYEILLILTPTNLDPDLNLSSPERRKLPC